MHANTDAKIAMQLGHAGAKGSTRVPWEGDGPMPLAERQLAADLGLAACRTSTASATGRAAMNRADMDRVRDDFVRATRYAAEAGFDWLELHCAHGYLLSSFISPLTNQRTDDYGGTLENRLRYPLEVFRGDARGRGRTQLPMSVRISAHDWVEGGITPDDAVRDRARLQGGRRRPDRLLVGPGQQAAEAGLRPHVPDAVRRPHPQRGRHRRPSPWARSPRPTM